MEKSWRMHWVTRPKTNDAMWNRCEDMLGKVYSFGGVSVTAASVQCSALMHKMTGRLRMCLDVAFIECDEVAERPLKYELKMLERMAR